LEASVAYYAVNAESKGTKSHEDEKAKNDEVDDEDYYASRVIL
jgi:hypothetical protein